VAPCALRTEAFLTFNQLSQKPSAFARYAVGIHANEEVALAIKDSLDTLNLAATPGVSSYGNGAGEPGQFAALAAAERIIKAGFKQTGTFEGASEHLVWVLTLTRTAYPDHGGKGAADAHDHDIIQAVSWIGLAYPKVVGDDEIEANLRRALTTWLGKDDKLHYRGTLMRPSNWRVALANAGTGSHVAGSQSRGQAIGGLIVRNYNREMRPQLRR
jgi:hypothetical protein